jgi:hypothetical protein
MKSKATCIKFPAVVSGRYKYATFPAPQPYQPLTQIVTVHGTFISTTQSGPKPKLKIFFQAMKVTNRG